MNQTDELATKRAFGVITLWTTYYLFSCRFNSFLSSYRFISYYCCSFIGVDSIFLQDTSLLCIHDLFRWVRYLRTYFFPYIPQSAKRVKIFDSSSTFTSYHLLNCQLWLGCAFLKHSVFEWKGPFSKHLWHTLWLIIRPQSENAR